MKSTGITRRIDDLGRIVIPKEIRKNLKIRENETLEIFIDNEDIILKKFSSLDDMDKVFERFIKVLEEISLNNILITDTQKIIKTSKNKEYDYSSKEIGSHVIASINNKESHLSKGIVELTLNKEVDANYYIKPIINNGDVLGTIIVFGNKEINEKTISSIDVIAKLIINYID